MLPPDAEEIIKAKTDELSRRYHIQPPHIVYSKYLGICYAEGMLHFHELVVWFVNNLIFHDRIADAQAFARYLAAHEFLHYLHHMRGSLSYKTYEWERPYEQRKEEISATKFGTVESGYTTEQLDALMREFNEFLRRKYWHFR